jgi:hypothetical protein
MGAREEVTIPPEYAKMLAVFADTSSQIDLGLHCSRCKQDLVGKNARLDTRWILECACRTFVGGNPLRAA